MSKVPLSQISKTMPDDMLLSAIDLAHKFGDDLSARRGLEKFRDAYDLRWPEATLGNLRAALRETNEKLVAKPDITPRTLELVINPLRTQLGIVPRFGDFFEAGGTVPLRTDLPEDTLLKDLDFAGRSLSGPMLRYIVNSANARRGIEAGKELVGSELTVADLRHALNVPDATLRTVNAVGTGTIKAVRELLGCIQAFQPLSPQLADDVKLTDVDFSQHLKTGAQQFFTRFLKGHGLAYDTATVGELRAALSVRDEAQCDTPGIKKANLREVVYPLRKALGVAVLTSQEKAGHLEQAFALSELAPQHVRPLPPAPEGEQRTRWVSGERLRQEERMAAKMLGGGTLGGGPG